MEKIQTLTVYSNSDEYQALIEECQAIMTEGVWNFRTEKILTYGRIGERITEDSLFEKYGKGNLKFLETIAKDTGISYSEICRSVQFYQKFKIVSPDSESWNKFKEGKNISWNKIKSDYLPERKNKDCKHDLEKVISWKCNICKKIFKEKPDEK